MEQQNSSAEIEIDVLELLRVLIDKIWFIILAGMIAGLAFIAATLLLLHLNMSLQQKCMYSASRTVTL